MTSSTPIVIGKGTSYDIGFNIRKWIDRPEATPEEDTAHSGTPPVEAEIAPKDPPKAPKNEDTDFGF